MASDTEERTMHEMTGEAWRAAQRALGQQAIDHGGTFRGCFH
jgi:hypothetical protein